MKTDESYKSLRINDLLCHLLAFWALSFGYGNRRTAALIRADFSSPVVPIMYNHRLNMILRIGTLLKAAPLRAPIRLPAGRLSPVTDPADKLKLSQGKLFTFCNRRSESAQALTLTKSGKSHRDSSQASAAILIGNENERES